ncbi:MAG: TonB-dependent receptor [Chitinispirillia bacterium]|nr:TonB-dependent receptor [Chitinispirillia bacterium]
MIRQAISPSFLFVFLLSAQPLLSEEVIELDEEVIELIGEEVIDLDDEEVIELADEIEFIDGDDELEKMPVIIEFVEADYPEELIKDGIEGTVLLELIVSETGGVDSVSVVRGLHPSLDSSAINAVRQFKFSPAQLTGGEKVAVMLQYEYRFSVREVITVPDSYVNFSGRVLERGTRRPVGEALIAVRFMDENCGDDLPMPFPLYMEQIGKLDGQSWEDGLIVTETDANGRFQFQSLPACKVQATLVLPDYEPYTTEEQIGRLEEVRVTYYVQRTDYSDYELVVYGKVEEKEVSRRQLTIAEVKRIPGLGGEAVRVVQAMPGVGRPSFGGNQVIVRGLPSWASRYYIDGMSVPLLYHIGGTTSSYPSEAVSTVDFYPGGFSTRYGGAVGGIIEMTSRKSKTDRVQGYVDLSMLDGAVFVEGPVNEKVSFMASGRRGFAGDLLNLYFKHAAPENMSITMAPFYWDYLLRTDIVIDKNHSMFVKLMGSRDSVGVFIPGMDSGTDEVEGELDQLNMKILFHTLMTGIDSRLSDRWTNSLRFSAGYASSAMSIFGMAKVNEVSYFTHLRDQVSYKASDNLTINAGADIEIASPTLELTIISGQNMIMRDTIKGDLYGMIGGYTTVEWKPIDKLLLVPGIRYDYYPELDYKGSLVPAYWNYGIMNNRRGASGEPSFRISSRYELTDAHTVKGAAGNYSQPPEPFGVAIHETWGNTDLAAAKAAHYVAGHEWQITDLLNLDVQAYYNNMWNVTRSYDERTDYDPSREMQRRFLDDGKERTYGVELMLRHSRSEKFFGWVSYTLSRSETWSKLDEKFILSRRDEPHHLQLLASWHLKNNWEVGTRTRYVSGKPTSPIIGTMESENHKYIAPIYGEMNSTRMDPFFQQDIRFDKKKIYNKWILTYYVDLQNILWPIYKSPEFVYWNYNYTQNQKIAMIPMISTGIRAEF